MRTHHFLRRLDHKRITQAIKKAEGRTSGQIRVFIQRGKFEDDALPRAERKFLQLGMQKTRDRNAVLIFVAPRAHKYAVVGDVGVHEKAGKEFWQRLVEAMRAHFKNEDFNRAIVHGISEAGKLLAAHFPRTGDTINELPDEIAHGCSAPDGSPLAKDAESCLLLPSQRVFKLLRCWSLGFRRWTRSFTRQGKPSERGMEHRSIGLMD